MNTRNTRVSVITRTKNRPLLLPRAAESVRCQNINKLIWIVVNDGGCKVDVETVIQDFRSRCDIEVIVIHNETSAGMEAATNIGIAACDSDYIVIHDDDDSWEPGFLPACLRFLHEKDSYKGVISLTTTVQEKVEGTTVKKLDSQPFNSHLQSVDCYCTQPYHQTFEGSVGTCPKNRRSW